MQIYTLHMCLHTAYICIHMHTYYTIPIGHFLFCIGSIGSIGSLGSELCCRSPVQSEFSRGGSLCSVARWSLCELQKWKGTMDKWITLHRLIACLFVRTVMYCLCCRLGELPRSRLFERSKWIVHKAQHRQQRAQFNREQQGSAGHEFILDGGAIAKIPPKSDT